MNQIAKVDDKSSLSISLPYLAQIVVAISVGVWGYANITEKIDTNAQETRNLRGNQNNYIFPDIRTLEQQVIALEKDMLIAKTEIEYCKKEIEKK